MVTKINLGESKYQDTETVFQFETAEDRDLVIDRLKDQGYRIEKLEDVYDEDFENCVLINELTVYNLDTLIDNLGVEIEKIVGYVPELLSSEYTGYDVYDESIKEDTVKQGSYWVNKGKEGTHGKFKTKKAADAQRKAMFARGFETKNEDIDRPFTEIPNWFISLYEEGKSKFDDDRKIKVFIFDNSEASLEDIDKWYDQAVANDTVIHDNIKLLDICPECGEESFNDGIGVCVNCGYDEKDWGYTGTDGEVFESLLDAFDELADIYNYKDLKLAVKDSRNRIQENIKESYDPYVIYKELGKFKGTPKSNFDAQFRNAHFIRDLSDFNDVQEIKSYFVKYGMAKNDDDFIIDKSVHATDDKLSESATTQIDALAKRYINKDGYSAVKDILFNIAGRGGIEIIDKVAKGFRIYESAAGEQETQPIEDVNKVEIANIINGLIKDEYDAIEGYNNAALAARDNKFNDIARVLDDIQAEENVHVGELQKLMELVDPNADKVIEGAEEVEAILDKEDIKESFDVTVDYELPVFEYLVDDYIYKIDNAYEVAEKFVDSAIKYIKDSQIDIFDEDKLRQSIVDHIDEKCSELEHGNGLDSFYKELDSKKSKDFMNELENDIIDVVISRVRKDRAKNMMEDIKDESKVVFTQVDPAMQWSPADDWEYGAFEDDFPGYIITGNKSFKSLGNKEFEDIFNEFNDEETILNALLDRTGNKYKVFEIHGSSQGDWNNLYVPEKYVDTDEITYIESIYFNTGDEYVGPDKEHVYVTSDVSYDTNKTKRFIAKHHGLSPDKIVLRRFAGYNTTPKYVEESK